MAPKRKAGGTAPSTAKASKKAKDEALQATDSPKDSPVTITVEACNAAELEKLLLEQAQDVAVQVNAEKPRKGTFEVRHGDKTYVSLQAMPRPFKKLRELDLEALVAELVDDLRARAERQQGEQHEDGEQGKRLGRRLIANVRSDSPSNETLSPLEILKRENELLRRTVEATERSVGELEAGLTDAGVGLPPAAGAGRATAGGPTAAALESDTPEDAWSPAVHVPEGQAFEEVYGLISPIPDHDGTECLKWDPTLWSHADHFKYRWHVFKSIRAAIDQNEGGLEKFTQGYKYYGFTRGEHEGKKGIWYREWAPGAKALALIGEFNAWQPKDEHWAIKNDFGVWQLFLPDNPDGTSAITHRTKVKLRLETAYGEWVERIPAWIKWATQ
ncbi:hypothetical protein N2152v2_010213, partial [Parachlorella kessleri]